MALDRLIWSRYEFFFGGGGKIENQEKIHCVHASFYNDILKFFCLMGELFVQKETVFLFWFFYKKIPARFLHAAFLSWR